MKSRFALLLAIAGGCASPGSPTAPRLGEPRQLTRGATHAEAYWSPDGRRLVFQARLADDPADQIYVLDVANGATRRITDGTGKAT